jgi:hypothetical protein
MNAQRIDFYKLVHKGVRALLGSLVAEASRLDFADQAQTAEFHRSLEERLESLLDHARHEDDFVMPLVRAVSPAVAATLDAAHDGQGDEIAAIRRQFSEARSSCDARDGHAFVLRLSRFQSEQLAHMADEEELAMPALWRAYDDATLGRVHMELIGSLPPEELARDGAWMLPAMTAPERAGLLGRSRQDAPPQVFQGMMRLAASVLTAADFARLERDLGLAESRVA